MVQDLKDGDETAAHGEAEDSAHVGNEPDHGYALVTLDLGHGRIFDVDVDQSQVLAGIFVQNGNQLEEEKNKVQFITITNLTLAVLSLVFMQRNPQFKN